MSAIADACDKPLAAASMAAKACFHCGLPVPAGSCYQVEFEGRVRPMCCVGCEAVARTIIDSGLDAFYRERTATQDASKLSATNAWVGNSLLGIERIEANYVAADGNHRSAELYVDGITCSACIWLAESALKRLPGVSAATMNQVTHRATVTWDATRTSLPVMLTALQRVGLHAQPATAAGALAARRKSRRRALAELGVALLSMMQVMMFTVPLYLAAGNEVSAQARQLMGWAAMVLTLPAMVYAARRFFLGAWRDLRHLQISHVSMDLPIAFAIAAGFATSCISLINGNGTTYFDSISMFIFLLLSARYLESSARESSLSLIERLTNAAPAVAWRVPRFPVDRVNEVVAAADLQPGDVIRIARGEMAAADGVIIDGQSEFDESLLTGESQPLTRGIHEPLVGGSLNLGSPVLVRVTRCGERTVAATLRQLTEQALASRPALVQLADRIARWIAPLTLLAALSTALVWLALDPGMSFPTAVAVLAVTCPCAMALAAPTAQALAIARLAREGLLITRADTLERIAAATDVLFDKTGTLTAGQISIESVQLLGKLDKVAVVEIAAALECGDSHPIALALARSQAAIDTGGAQLIVENARSVSGAGVEGWIDGARFRLGQWPFVHPIVGAAAPVQPHPKAATLFLATDGAWLAAFTLSDPLKPGAAQAIKALLADGLQAHLLSGDRRDRVTPVALEVGIADAQVRAQYTPVQKLEYARQLQQRGANLIAVGDGVNDAPLMGAAQVSIAMGRGADLTRLTADAALMSAHLQPLVTARQVARKLNRVIRQNFCWAIAYNALALPLAMMGRISPAWAAIGMAASSLIVVANSSRLARGRR